MAKAAVTDNPAAPARLRLSPAKSAEVVGILLAVVALGLLLALVSYHPTDPSLFHTSTHEGAATARNWLGQVGANLSALMFGLVGLVSLLIPLALGIAAVRRFRGTVAEGGTLRVIGTVVVVLSLPALLQATVGTLPWRGAALAVGGAFGRVLAAGLESKLALPGTLLVLTAVVALGTVLAVQTTLGDLARAWMRRIAEFWLARQLARERRRERKEKELSRRRVVAKHLHRVMEEQRQGGVGMPDALDGMPGRVVERRGQRPFTVRRVPASQLAPPVAESSVRPTVRPGLADFEALDQPLAPAGQALPPVPQVPRPVLRPAPPPLTPAGPVLPPRPAALAQTAPAAPAAEPRQLVFVETSEGPRSLSLPPINLLQQGTLGAKLDENELVRLGEVIRLRCAEFGVEGTIEGISPGPVITVYEFQPAPGVKVSQIVNLQDELALALKAASVRIDRLAGRSTLGIEVPNDERLTIRLGSLLADDKFQRARSPLTMALGVTIHGEPYYADLAQMPHLLVAGATGAGKSVGLQSMITSIFYKATPEEVRFIFIDPKRVELGVYADIPNLETKVVTEPQQAANVLNNMVMEMERRYKLLAEVHVRSIAHYNAVIKDPSERAALSFDEDGVEPAVAIDSLEPLPYFVIIIDELADLMMVASSEVETSIARIAQKARAVGIHLIVATQRPSVDVLTGTIKANFPCRLAYATATRHDSRTILDQNGSEQLLGKGDALFMPPGSSRILRLHGSYVSEQETAGLVRWLKRQAKPEYNLDLLKAAEGERGSSGAGGDDVDDDLYDEASRLVVAERMGSASFLQRRLRIGFSRAARLIDLMEQDGLLGPPQGSKPREVLVAPGYFAEIDAVRGDDELA